MVREVITIYETASVKGAVAIMNRLEISSIIATRNEDPIGIVSERDILNRIVTEGKNAKQLKSVHNVRPADGYHA